MKIVVCENCGAKYQLNDDDDIDAFECSSCTGKLRELETIVDEDALELHTNLNLLAEWHPEYPA